jgi:hypothetical protein
MCGTDPRGHNAGLDQSGEAVGQRQKEQCGRSSLEQVVQPGQRIGDVGVEIAMREHATLGPSGGAARVDHRRQVVGADGRASLLYLLGGHPRAQVGELGDGAGEPSVGAICHTWPRSGAASRTLST